jgi:hypothetical protein
LAAQCPSKSSGRGSRRTWTQSRGDDGENAAGGLLVARVGANEGLRIAERPNVMLKLNRFTLFDANSGTALP